MRKQWAALLLPILFAVPSLAQKMSAVEYRGFLTSLDLSTVRWQTEINEFHVESLDVNFSVGKAIDKQKDGALDIISLIRRVIRRQLIHERLSDDVTLGGSLEDVATMLSGIVSVMPDREESVAWNQKFADLNVEISPLDLELRKHILAYANELQTQAERCHR